MTTDSLATTPRRVQRVRHELKRRSLQVLRVDAISPHFRSVTFTGDALADFVSASFDDHVKFILDADGAAPVGRDYTPRRFDAAARELTIEFALHGDGPAANWAAQARAGQQATIGGPRGSFIIPLDYDWHLFVGDETALPAISRRLEELPAGVQALVLVQLDDAADRRQFTSAARLSVQWIDGTAGPGGEGGAGGAGGAGASGGPGALAAAVRALALPAGEGYAWCAGEAAQMAAVRRILVEEKGHDRQAIRAAAYWKQGAAAHHENLEG